MRSHAARRAARGAGAVLRCAVPVRAHAAVDRAGVRPDAPTHGRTPTMRLHRRPERSRFLRRLALVAAALATLVPAARIAADPRPLEPMDAGEIAHALHRLQAVGSALYVAAHPDDENTALLAWLTH